MLKKVLLLLCLSCIFTLFGAELVSDGTSKWRIVISPKATSTEVYAAKEFQNHIAKISGAKLPIVKSKKIPARNAVVIGFAKTMPALPKALLNFPKKDLDSLRVASFNGNLYLLGNSHRGALYAVYAFLKNVCGVRWYRPGKGWDGTYLPAQKNLHFSDKLNLSETGSFKYRGFHLCGKHYDREMERWMTRNRINIMNSNPPTPRHPWRKQWHKQRIAQGMYMVFSSHNVAIYDKKVFAAHPEYFAKVNGKPIPDQLCWSNPEVDKILIERFIKECKTTPDLEILSLSAADNMNYCRCEKCAKHKLNDLWFALFQRIIDGVAKACPQVKFSTIAYQSYLEPPRTPLRNVEFIKYCMYNRCYVHDIKACKINQRPMAHIKKWQQQGVPVVVYGYEFDIFKPQMQPPFYHMLADGMKAFHAADTLGSFPEVNAPAYKSKTMAVTPGKMYELGYYVYAALLWNHNANVEDIIAEYSRAAYGAAGREMAQYAISLSRAWSKMPIHYTYFFNSPLAGSAALLSPALVNKIENHFRKAETFAKAVKNPAERKRITANIAAEKAVFDLWLKTFRNYTSAQNNTKISLPLAAKAFDFTAAATVQKFKSRSGKKTAETIAKINYDRKNLYLEVTCFDPDMKNLTARAAARDSKVFTDDSIEIFIAVPNDTRGIYRHIAVSSNGTIYDAIALGNNTFDRKWDPDLTVKTGKGKNFWRLQLAIPFAALGSTPKSGDVWQFALKRNPGAGRKNFNGGGFPDDGVHEPNDFGIIQFTAKSKAVSALYFYPGKAKDIDEMKMLFEKSGFATTLYRDAQSLSRHKQRNDIYIIRIQPKLRIDQKLFDRVITPALKDGALVVLFGWGKALAPDKFFRDPKLALQWSGWKIHRQRKSHNVKKGAWLTTPNDLTALINKGMTPAGGFRPRHPAAWESLARLQMADSSLVSYLLSCKIGKGRLVVGCFSLGVTGGATLFGSRKEDSQKLLENLYELTVSGK